MIFDKKECLRNQDHPFNQFCMYLVTQCGSEFKFSGTAVRISKDIAITAKHVIEDFQKDLNGKKYTLFANQFIKESSGIASWKATCSLSAPYTDLSILYLNPSPKNPVNSVYSNITIDVITPKKGDVLKCFGYANPEKITFENLDSFLIGHEIIETIGKVEDEDCKAGINAKNTIHSFMIGCPVESSMCFWQTKILANGT